MHNLQHKPKVLGTTGQQDYLIDKRFSLMHLCVNENVFEKDERFALNWLQYLPVKVFGIKQLMKMMIIYFLFVIINFNN
jgi:hypothetical protein